MIICPKAVGRVLLAASLRLNGVDALKPDDAHPFVQGSVG
jgi:hypothetical protein